MTPIEKAAEAFGERDDTALRLEKAHSRNCFIAGAKYILEVARKEFRSFPASVQGRDAIDNFLESLQKLFEEEQEKK